MHPFVGHLRPKEVGLASFLAVAPGEALGLGLLAAPALDKLTLQLAELGRCLERAKAPGHR